MGDKGNKHNQSFSSPSRMQMNQSANRGPFPSSPTVPNSPPMVSPIPKPKPNGSNLAQAPTQLIFQHMQKLHSVTGTSIGPNELVRSRKLNFDEATIKTALETLSEAGAIEESPEGSSRYVP